ncbi:hypothetical protein Cgig2_017518 [Carnegiea gigantea]|uniref:Uncharacterized protein n=1 Tax=Carnegiea gigantea TaxID=171969 RepID=A0A9Q1QCS8_9CARY|nr:hypothetical protein Cgig2_017518 [Carnegiea gigantea]
MAPENQAHTEPLASTDGSPPAPKEPFVACGSEREPPIGAPNDLIKEDVYAMFALPMSLLEVQAASTCEPTTEHTKPVKRRRTRTGATKVRKMVEKILERGDHGEQFQRDFVLHIISTSIIRNSLYDVQTNTYSCGESQAFYIFGVVELSLEKKDAKTDGFQQQYIGQLMLLNKEIKIKRSFAESMEGERQFIGKGLCAVDKVLYLDRIEFTGKRCKDRWLPIAIHWTTDVVK